MFKNILLASDGSEHAERAAQHAIKLAAMYQGEVTVLFVHNPLKSKEAEQKIEQEVEHLQQRLKNTEASLREKHIPYNIEVVKGEPAPEIIAYANKNAYDALVIGSRGLNALQEMVLGSVSHKVLKHTKCPVLVVK